jgi:hypothetical protein
MTSRLAKLCGPAALVVSLVSLVVAMSGVSLAGKHHSGGRAGALVRLNAHGKVPAGLIPKVKRAHNSDRVGGKSSGDLTAQCNELTVDMGSWCIMSAPYALTSDEVGKNDYFFATQKCADLGGYLPTAAQLIGAASRIKLASTINDNATTASIDEDPTDGTKDRREMSATLITTASGSRAAGSEGVSQGSRGDPRQGEPDPVPQPSNPSPDTLQYATVYDNGDHGGFAGGEPVGKPELFRCAFDKQQSQGATIIGP